MTRSAVAVGGGGVRVGGVAAATAAAAAGGGGGDGIKLGIFSQKAERLDRRYPSVGVTGD